MQGGQGFTRLVTEVCGRGADTPVATLGGITSDEDGPEARGPMDGGGGKKLFSSLDSSAPLPFTQGVITPAVHALMFEVHGTLTASKRGCRVLPRPISAAAWKGAINVESSGVVRGVGEFG
jgi:hypothetical protein